MVKVSKRRTGQRRIQQTGKDSRRLNFWALNGVSKPFRYPRQRNVLGRGNSTEAVNGMKYGICEKQQESWYGLSKVNKMESRTWDQSSRGKITEAMVRRSDVWT